MMIEKLKEVLDKFQDEPCVEDGIMCQDCTYNKEIIFFDAMGSKRTVSLCDVLEALKHELGVR